MTERVRDTNPDLDALKNEIIGIAEWMRDTSDDDRGPACDDLSDAVDVLIDALRSERAGREKAETLLIELLGIEAMDAITWMKKARALAGEGDTDETP